MEQIWPQSARRTAILVGVNAYDETKSGLSNLRNAVNDAEVLAKILKKDSCSFDVETLLNCSSGDVNNTIARKLNQADAQELIVIYFSGHGKIGANGGLYLCTTDTDAAILRTSSVSLSLIRDLIDDSAASQIVIILDCCYSGEARSSLKSDIASLLQTDIGSGRGKYLVASSTGFQVSHELPDDENSLFTKWFTEGLQSGAADLNKDGLITLKEAFKYAKAKVEQENPRQNPEHWEFESSLGDVEIARFSSNLKGGKSFEESSENLNALVANIDEPFTMFMGSGLYGSGVLSQFWLADAISKGAGLKSGDRYPIAEAAGHLERQIVRRRGFIDKLKKIIGDGRASLERPSAFDLVLRMIQRGGANDISENTEDVSEPLFIVSTTLDLELENYLIGQGVKLSILAHGIRAERADHVGKLLEINPAKPISKFKIEDEQNSFVLYDHWLPADHVDCVVYKMLGSPFLCSVNPKTKKLDFDCVVATENDYAQFLARLEGSSNNIPPAVSVALQNSVHLFLGYTLDIWQYRILTTILQVEDKIPRFAIRQPTTPIESLCWKELGVEVIPGEINKVTNQLLQTI